MRRGEVKGELPIWEGTCALAPKKARCESFWAVRGAAQEILRRGLTPSFKETRTAEISFIL